jgi:hypothetical protein
VVAEQPEVPVDVQVDRGRLDALLAQGIDRYAPGVDLFAYGSVGQDHR